jgi:hypothetical protein
MGLFRRMVAIKNVVLWVHDPWLTALPIQLEKVKFQRANMQEVWLEIGRTFEKYVGHFIKNIRESVIPLHAIRTIFHSSPVVT